MTENQILALVEKEGALLEQFLFIMFFSNPTTHMVKLIVDDGSIRMNINYEKFLFLLNELLQPRTMEMEKNFQRIKASLNSYGKWYYFDRVKNEFRELLELPEKEHISPKDLFANKDTVQQEINERFKATAEKYETEVISMAPIPKETSTITNKLYSFFKRRNEPKRKN
jgi:hypothetical protein